MVSSVAVDAELGQALAAVPRLDLSEARSLIARAVAKADELRARGSFVVVDDGGYVISASRMDGAGPMSIVVSRAKAHSAAVNRETTARWGGRLTSPANAAIYSAFQSLMREKPFPGPGALPIVRHDRIVGAMSTGGGLGPFLNMPGVHPSQYLVDGKPGNLEDVLIAHALQVPYEGQHGDDLERWMQVYGFAPDAIPADFPVREVRLPPLAVLSAALAAADRGLARARELGVRVSIVIVDRCGDPLQVDRMDGAPPIGPDVALNKAATALNFRRPSGELAERYAAGPGLAAVDRVVSFTILPVAGGLPIMRDGAVVGAIGVSGATAQQDEQVARAALGG